MTTTTSPAELLESVQRLTRDLKTASITLSPREARYLVDAYYALQDYRIAAANQVRALTMSEEPHDVINWMFGQMHTLEDQVKRALAAWAGDRKEAQWAQSIPGIGPILAAGLLAHIDIEQAPSVGHIWRFAGLDPTRTWLGREKARVLYAEFQGTPEERLNLAADYLRVNRDSLLRQATVKTGKVTAATAIAALSRRPWSASLKTLCWKIGESFVKVSSNDADIYGRVYRERKLQEWGNNLAGLYADQARAILGERNIGKDTDAYPWYAGLYVPKEGARPGDFLNAQDAKVMVTKAEGGLPMLPPAHINARAKRYAVKLFLAHYHHVAYMIRYGVEPPKPYILQQPGHTHFIAPPNWPASDRESPTL